MTTDPDVHASLAGRFIVLGVTGGIAAYKAVEVCRQLVDAGAHVAPVLTADAQRFVGALTFTVLVLASLKAPREQRVQVFACVAVATCFEIFGSLVWGVYRYRMHNLPLFVPPGHGIVYLFGLLAAQTPVVRRHGRRVAYAVLGAACAWAALGLTVLPAVTGRLDVQGALCLPVFAYFLLRSPRWPLFAAQIRDDFDRNRRPRDAGSPRPSPLPANARRSGRAPIAVRR